MTAQMDEGLELHRRPEGAAKQPRKQLARGLHPALRPAPLLHQERSRRARKLGRNADVVPQNEAPPRDLGPVADVQVLGQGVGLPSPRVDERLAAPQPRGPVEVEEPSPTKATLLLQKEVAIEEKPLRPGEPRVVLVEVVPPGLHHPHAGVGHRGEEFLEEGRRGDEIGVEDEYVLTRGRFQARGERARLVAGSHAAVEHLDVHAPAPPCPRPLPGERRGLVGGVVQHLDLQVRARMAQPARRVDEPLHHVLLVENGQLNRHAGRRGVRPGVRALPGRGLPPRQEQQRQPVSRKRQQQRQHERVGQHRGPTQHVDHGRTCAGRRIPMNPRCLPVSPRRCE